MSRPQVIDPLTNQRISIEKAALEPNGWQGRCNCCQTTIEVRARNSARMEPHFWHATQGTGCPLIEQNARNYIPLPPGAVDPANAVAIKEWLFQNLRGIYFFCKEELQCKALNYEEFRDCIRSATVARAWEARGLTTLFVPYLILVYAKGFEVNRWRSESFYYAFEPTVGNVDELWIHPERHRTVIFKIETISRACDDFRICGMSNEQLNPGKALKGYFESIQEEIRNILGL